MTERRLRRLIAFFSLIGVGVAGYLSYVHARGIHVQCVVGGGGCETVQKSQWAELGGVSVAYIGLAGYIAILLSLLLKGENGRFLTAALAVPGWAFSAYLTYRELFSVKLVCPWCVTSFTMITIVMVLSVWRLLRGEDGGAFSKEMLAE